MFNDDGWAISGNGTALQAINLKISLIGSGNFAWTFARGVEPVNDLEIVQVISRSLQHASQLASYCHAQASNRLSALTDETDICLIAVNDDAIPVVAAQLPTFSNTIFAHTAGSVDSLVLGQFTHHGVFYPLQTLSKNVPMPWSNIPVLTTSSNPIVGGTLSTLGGKLGSSVLKITDEQRLSVHLAAVLANNFSNAMYGAASGLLADSGLPFSLLHPLIQEGASKATRLDPIDAQTGPAIRGDHSVQKKHLSLLEDYPQLKELYQLVSQFIAAQGSS